MPNWESLRGDKMQVELTAAERDVVVAGLISKYGNSPAIWPEIIKELHFKITPESWSWVATLEHNEDKLYKSSHGRYMVACVKPSEVEGGIENYILDIDAMSNGIITGDPDSIGSSMWQFPRIKGYPLTEEKDAAQRLVNALRREGVIPKTIKWIYTLDAQ